MNILNTYISDAFSHALGWTILHSIWQGLLIGGICYLILRIWKNSPPEFRYLLGVFSLGAIFASAVTTFIVEYHTDPILQAPFEIGHDLSGHEDGILFAETGTAANSLKDRYFNIKEILSASFPWISMIWILGVFILSVRLTGGLFLIGRMRTRGLSPLPSAWNKRLEILLRKSRIRNRLKFRESGMVNIPTVIGILRPVVLIPAGMISLMPVEQMESIIAHELAHIRRHDFLINIFQSIVEALFFYHPIVWILSESIRHEREKCCDDFAVNICGRISIYASALASLTELQNTTRFPAVALSGSKNKIIIRVERLLNQKMMKTNANQKIYAGFLILVSAVILTISTGASLSSKEYGQGTFLRAGMVENSSLIRDLEATESGEVKEPRNISKAAEKPAKPANFSLPDTSNVMETTNMEIKDNIVTREFINKEGKEESIKFVIRKGEVEELYVNGEQIPESDFQKYEKEIDKTLDDLADMDSELREARKEIEEVDWEEISREVQESLEDFRQQDMKSIQEEMEKVQMQQFEMQLDQEKIQKEIQEAMEKVRVEMENFDSEKVMQEYEKAMQKYQEIDFEKIEKELEAAYREIEQINFEEIEMNIQEALTNIDLEKLNLDKEMSKIDDLIIELEKLELKEK